MTDKKILVADDESHILNVVSLKLRNAGFTVVTARDGDELVELARRERPDLLITDYHMPGRDGLAACRALRAEGVCVPAILLSARGYNLTPADMADTGILTMIGKPFSPRQLLETVTATLNASSGNAAVSAVAA